MHNKEIRRRIRAFDDGATATNSDLITVATKQAECERMYSKVKIEFDELTALQGDTRQKLRSWVKMVLF